MSFIKGAGEVDIERLHLIQVCAKHLRFDEAAVVEGSQIQIGMKQIGAGKIRRYQPTLTEIGPFQVRPFQAGL